MNRSRFVAALAALTAAATATVVLAGSATAKPARATATPTTRVTVKAFEFGFTLSKKVFPRGKVIFTVINQGDLGHDFVVAIPGGKSKATPLIRGGRRATLTVTFTKRGRYQYLCAVGEHFLRGMEGTVRVR